MSDLQLALIVIGAVLVAAVFAYNKWQEARYRRQADAGLAPSQTDVLLRSTAEARPARMEPTLDVAEAAPAITPVAEPARGVLSEVLDFIVELEPPSPAPGRALVEAAMQPLSRMRKAVGLEGMGAAGWESLERERTYERMRVGVQLVDRRGRSSAAELDAFAAAVAQASGTAGMTARPGSSEQALAAASRLDALCEQVDIQIVVHVVSREGLFAGTKVRALAEAAGMALEDDGRFRKRDEAGLELFSMSNEEAAAFSAQGMKTLSTGSVSIELDIPRAPGGAEAFLEFRDFAERFAAGLGGTVVDDNRAPLGAAGFEAIGLQLQPVYETLQDHGIPAGSPLALRLFS